MPPARLELNPRPTISGRVVVRGSATLPPWERGEVITQRANDVWSLLTQVGAAPIAEDGTFAVQPLTDSIELGLLMPPQGFRLDQVLVDGRDRIDESLSIAEFEGADVEMVLTASGGLLSGTVTWPSGPRDRCRVVAFSTESRHWHATSRRVAITGCDDGQFLAGPLPPGEYHVAAVSSDASLEAMPKTFGSIADRGTRVAIRGDGVTTLALPVVILDTSASR